MGLARRASCSIYLLTMFNCAHCSLRDLNNAARLELDAVLFVVEPNTMNKEQKDQKPRTKCRVSDRVITGHRDQRSEVTSGKLWISSWSIGI